MGNCRHVPNPLLLSAARRGGAQRLSVPRAAPAAGLRRNTPEYERMKEERSQVLWRAVERVIPDARQRAEITLVRWRPRAPAWGSCSWAPRSGLGLCVIPGVRRRAEIALVRQRAALVSCMCALRRSAECDAPSARRRTRVRALLRWHRARVRLTSASACRLKQSFFTSSVTHQQDWPGRRCRLPGQCVLLTP
jgi:hypothetical protein